MCALDYCGGRLAVSAMSLASAMVLAALSPGLGQLGPAVQLSLGATSYVLFSSWLRRIRMCLPSRLLASTIGDAEEAAVSSPVLLLVTLASATGSGVLASLSLLYMAALSWVVGVAGALGSG